MGEKKLRDGILSTLNVCMRVFVYSPEYGWRFPMWHYVDIHDQLICLTSSLFSQMDPLLEPFSNQPPAPAKPSIFTISNVLFLVNKLQSLTGTNPHMEIRLHFPNTIQLHNFPSWQPMSVYGVLLEPDMPMYTHCLACFSGPDYSLQLRTRFYNRN